MGRFRLFTCALSLAVAWPVAFPVLTPATAMAPSLAQPFPQSLLVVHRVEIDEPAGLVTIKGVAFDGANIWVTALDSGGGMTKLRASDGTHLGTFGVGANPRGVAFDGANIWVANQGSDSVSKY